jgi:hypothetical protein
MPEFQKSQDSRMAKVLKQRSRLVNFRLTEDEYEEFKWGCSLTGARNMSDFARSVVLQHIHGSHNGHGMASHPVQQKLQSLDRRVEELEALIKELTASLNNQRAATA